MLRKFNIKPEKAKVLYRPGKVQYDKHGKPVTCENCQGTGFYGRIAVFEMIIMNQNLKESIEKAKSLPEIDSHLRGAKMLYLQEQALRRVLDGTLAINEMIRVLSGDKKAQSKRPKQESKPAKSTDEKA